MRYVLEGTWTGYEARQQRVVHREVVTAPKRIERLRGLHSIRYTDGTSLILLLREAEHRERVIELHSYDALIRECEAMPGQTVRIADCRASKRAPDTTAPRGAGGTDGPIRTTLQTIRGLAGGSVVQAGAPPCGHRSVLEWRSWSLHQLRRLRVIDAYRRNVRTGEEDGRHRTAATFGCRHVRLL